MNEPINPIIKYLISDESHMFPVGLGEELKTIALDDDVRKYLQAHAEGCALAALSGPGASAKAALMAAMAGMAVGYLYGKEGNKTSEEIATQLLKDLNIREGV